MTLSLEYLKPSLKTPHEGDFVKLIEDDFKLINEKFDKTKVISMTKNSFKKWVKKRIEKAAFEYLLKEQEKQSKIKDMKYDKFELQQYLKSSLFSNYEIEMLAKLRSKMVDVKANFSTKYSNNLECSIKDCVLEENQEHIMSNCQSIQNKLKFNIKNVTLNDIFSKSTKKQNNATKKFIKVFEIRDKILTSN